MLKQKKKRYIYIFSTFLLSFITKIVYLMHPFAIKMVSDNFGCLLGSAYLAGLDWRQAAPSNYYGQGWYIIYSLLFRITTDAYLIYKIIIVTNIVLISATSILIYLILVEFLEQKDSFFNVLMATICVHFITDPGNGTRISSEPPVFIFTWFICFFLIYTYYYKKDKKKHLMGVIALVFFQSYGLLIHTRMAVVIISIMLCIALFYLVYKEWIINPLVYATSTFVAMGFMLGIKKWIVNILWKSDSAGKIHNYNLGADRIFKVKYSIKAIVDTFFSNIYKLVIETDGIFCVGIILFIVLIIKIIIRLAKKKQGLPCERKDKLLFVMFVTFTFCVVICMCGVVILYADQINSGYIAGKENDRFSGLTYTRYYFSFAGPMLLAVLVMARSKKELFVKYYKWVFPVWIFLFIYIYRSVIPELNEYLSRFMKKKYTDDTVINIFLTFYVISNLLILFFILIKHNKSNWFIGLMLAQIFYNGVSSVQKPYLQVYSNTAGASYSLITTIEKDFALPQEIYTYRIRKDETQLLLSRHTVIPLENIEDLINMDETLLLTGNISDKEKEYLLQIGYVGTKVDGNEIIWSNSVELIGYIQEQVTTQ